MPIFCITYLFYKIFMQTYFFDFIVICNVRLKYLPFNVYKLLIIKKLRLFAITMPYYYTKLY